MRISLERSILVAEQFLQELIKKYGKYPVSTDDGGTWYPQACRFLKLRHHTHSYYEKSIIIERTIQYIKDRTECFDDYFPCQKDNCTLEHVRNWFNLFVDVHNSMIIFAVNRAVELVALKVDFCISQNSCLSFLYFSFWSFDSFIYCEYNQTNCSW